MFPDLSPLARAILADWDDPRLSEVTLAARHALSIDALLAQAVAPSFQAALAKRRALRELRRRDLLARAEDQAAEILAALTTRPPDSNAAAKEIRLAIKDHHRLLTPDPGAGASQPSDRPQADPRGADLQSASRAQPELPSPTSSPAGGAAGEVPERSEGGGGNPEPLTHDTPLLTLRARQDANPSPLRADGVRPEEPNTPPASPKPTPTFKPKSNRGYKSRPKSRSR